jgi:hypothetical protein
MRPFLAVSAVLLVVAVGLGAAAAAGAFTAAPVAAKDHAVTVHAARALPQDDPTSAVMRRVLIGGEPGTITPAAPRTLSVGIGSAKRAAMAGPPGWGHGSRILGTALAYVTQPGLARHRLMWLVSEDLAGGLTNPGGPDSGALKPDNYIVAFIDAKTGRWRVTMAGESPSLPSLPVIHG